MRRKDLYKIYLLFACLAISLAVFAQKNDAGAKTRQLISSNAARLGLSLNDQKNLVILNEYDDKTSGLHLVYAQQTYKGIGVYNSIQVMAFKNNQLASTSGTRIPKMEMKTKFISEVPGLSAANAVDAAVRYLQLPLSKSFTLIKEEKEAHKTTFANTGISKDNITAQLMWVPLKDGLIKLGWQVQIAPLKTSDLWLIRMDAVNGAFIAKDNLTVYENINHAPASAVNHHYNQPNKIPYTGKFTNTSAINSSAYRVIPYPAESPLHPGGTADIKVDPWSMAPGDATTLKWNSDGTYDYDFSAGNNVYAQEDRDANNSTFGNFAVSSTPVPDLNFDAIPDYTQDPTTTANQQFALTNLFYWNNIIHDITYQYGFDEVAGNFQYNNLDRGGSGGDPVIADGQDAGGLSNANFSTPPDGYAPRMQMYLWKNTLNADQMCQVNAPADIAGYINALQSAFSENNLLENVGPVSGDVVYYNDDAEGTSHLACGPPANSLAGKIALIDRGNCAFTIKVKNAQDAGAIGVIMVNNVPDNSVLIMSGADNSITIPAVMISYLSGNTIKAELSNNTVNITLNKLDVIIRDGDVDNGIITHEYTHGISNRLTGGPSQISCLGNWEQMGEGWSDYYALMLTTDWASAQITDGTKSRPMGNYAIGADPVTGPGIRAYPYSTDMSVNPWTYAMLATNTGGESHYIGEPWCATLWDMTWELIQIDNINPNLYDADGAGGNVAALKLVTLAMKLQPCAPGFIDGRDAILKADSILYNGKYHCAIWHAFARRGMGINASQGSSYDYLDQVADYTVPVINSFVKTADADTVHAGEVIHYSLAVSCACGEVNNYQLRDTLPANTINKTGGIPNIFKRVFTVDNISLAPSQTETYNVKVRVKNNAKFFDIDKLKEPVRRAAFLPRWKRSSGTATPWVITRLKSKSTPYALYAQDYDVPSDATIETRKAYTLKGKATLSFWHYFDTEAGWDGGVVEIFVDGAWKDLGPYMVSNGYNGRLNSGFPILSKNAAAFTGNSDGSFIKTEIDLSAFTNKEIRLRFRFFSDINTGGDGWYIDDILLNDHSAVINIAALFDANNVQQGMAVASSIIVPGTTDLQQADAIAASKLKDNGLGDVLISPNPARNKITVRIKGNTKPLELMLVNSMGQNSRQYNMQGESAQFDVSSLPAGIYNLLITGNNINASFKILIAR